MDNDIEGDDKSTFWDNKQFTQYLYADRSSPEMWIPGGMIEKTKTYTHKHT